MTDWIADLSDVERSADWDSLVGAVEPDGHGRTILPFFTGERSPGWNDAARLTVHGVRRHTSSADFMRAGMEAVTHRLALIYNLLSAVVQDTHVVALSGEALRVSAQWAQMLTDSIGRRTMYPRVVEASSRGAAVWVLSKIGGVRMLGDGELADGQVLLPDQARGAVYRSAVERQERLYQRMAGFGGL